MEKWELDIEDSIRPRKDSTDILLINKETGAILDRIDIDDDIPDSVEEWDVSDWMPVDIRRLQDLVNEKGFEGLEIVKESEYKPFYKFDELSNDAQKKVFEDIQKDEEKMCAIEQLNPKKFTSEELKEKAAHGIYFKNGWVMTCYY